MWWKDPLDVRGTKMFRLQTRMKYIKTKLKAWNQEDFGNIFDDKQALERQMEVIHNNWIQGTISQDSINT